MKRAIYILVVTFIIGIFITSAYYILKRHFQKGVDFPPYSSLRYDPMGTSLLVDSLKNMGYKTSLLTENILPLELIPKNTILFCIWPDLDFNQEERDSIIDFIYRGGRVFLAIQNTNSLMTYFDTRIYNKKDTQDGHYRYSKRPDNTFHSLFKEEEEKRLKKAIPGEIFYFLEDGLPITNESQLEADWPKTLTIYSDGEKDLLISLSHGLGEIIISSEVYFISNQNLIKDPPLLFLNWLLKGRKQILMDEYHHGIKYTKGISYLFTKYGFYWFSGYLLMFFLLYLWHIIPRFRRPLSRPDQGPTQAHSSIQGHAHLLRKTIPQNALIKICIEQWLKSRRTIFIKKKGGKIKVVAGTKEICQEKDILNKYNEIVQFLKDF